MVPAGSSAHGFSCSRRLSPLSGRNSTYRLVQISGTGSNRQLLTKWSKDLVEDLKKKLAKKALSGFDPKLYPMKTIKQKALERHPLLARWGGVIRDRVYDWRDRIFIESQGVIGAMLTLMRDYQVPSLPVHDSLIVPGSKF